MGGTGFEPVTSTV